MTLSSHTAQATLPVRLVTRDAVCDSSHTLSSVTRWLVSRTDDGFITGHSIRLVLQDSQFGHLGQVCTLSRQDIRISAVPIRLITRRHSLFAHSSTSWGFRLHSRSAYCPHGTDPMRLTMFRRQPLIQMFRYPDSRGSARNCESAIREC